MYLSCIPQNTRIKGVFYCIVAYFTAELQRGRIRRVLLCISVYLLVFNEYCVIHVRYALDTHLIRYLVCRVTWDQGWWTSLGSSMDEIVCANHQVIPECPEMPRYADECSLFSRYASTTDSKHYPLYALHKLLEGHVFSLQKAATSIRTTYGTNESLTSVT